MGFALGLLCWTALVSLSAAALVVLTRELPFVQTWMMQGKKPWVCNLCMSWWTTLLAGTGWVLLEKAPTSLFLGAFSLTLILVNHLGQPKTKPDFQLEDIPEIPE